jgi:hypothetical protein
MSEHEYSHPELKITAILYSGRPGVVDHVKRTGKLPKSIPNGGMEIALRKTIQRRGLDPDLSEDELLVYKAILRENRLPGGVARLVNAPDQD